MYKTVNRCNKSMATIKKFAYLSTFNSPIDIAK